MKITYYGHSALGIIINDIHIIVDPFISGNPKASEIDVKQLKADYILLTHAHSDHVLDVEEIAERTGATIIANHEIATYYNTRHNFETFGMNQGGCAKFDFGKVCAVEAIHSSSFVDGTYGGNPLGFILKAHGKTIYISGDTDLFMNMKLIPMFHQPDLAILCMGGTYTMDVDRAVMASEFVNCNQVMGVHFDTMPIIEINHEEAKKKFKKEGKELFLLKVGESMTI